MLNRKMKIVFWWICLIVAPIILATIELFHPAGFTENPGMFQYLSVPQAHTHEHMALFYFGPQWWFILHMIQTPLVCLVAIGFWLLVGGINDDDGKWPVVAAWLSRFATFLFMIYYTVLDSIGGIGLGKTIEITNRFANAPVTEPHITPEQLEGVKLVLNTTWVDPWVGGVGSFVSHTGSYAVLFATLFAAIALFLAKKASWPPLLILVAAGYELQISHASFHGPIAFSLLAISSIWLWVAYRQEAVKMVAGQSFALQAETGNQS